MDVKVVENAGEGDDVAVVIEDKKVEEEPEQKQDEVKVDEEVKVKETPASASPDLFSYIEKDFTAEIFKIE